MEDWISVKDKLPEHGKYVLCYIQPRYTNGDFQQVLFQRDGIWDNYNSIVTHWQPLPKPPNK